MLSRLFCWLFGGHVYQNSMFGVKRCAMCGKTKDMEVTK